MKPRNKKIHHLHFRPTKNEQTQKNYEQVKKQNKTKCCCAFVKFIFQYVLSMHVKRHEQNKEFI